MAVQAQYPSNVLFLNRNGQDRKNMFGSDYSLQAQPSLFPDQSQMFFINGGSTNPRKRGREETAPINLFSLQPQPPSSNLINLPQLHNQQPNVVSTGLHLSFGEQQNQQNQLQNNHQQSNQEQNRHLHQSMVLPSSIFSSILSEDLAVQIKQQKEEMDQFLQAQGDQLRRTLAERRKKHYRALLEVAEESASQRLREKEIEMEKVVRRNAELEDRVGQLRVEAQVWIAKARAQEATAVSLQAQLQQAMMMNGGAQDKREEGLGCSGDGDAHAEDAESAYIDPERVISSAPVCKVCRRRAASVVLLPCRHLCVCTDCGAGVVACPLCLSQRTACVEVLLS